MTREEALKQAQQRWGTDLHYLGETGPFAIQIRTSYLPFRVGNGKHPHTYGWGDSWEAAFADADKREVQP